MTDAEILRELANFLEHHENTRPTTGDVEIWDHLRRIADQLENKPTLPTDENPAEFAVKVLRRYAEQTGSLKRSTSDLSPLEEWLIIELMLSRKSITLPTDEEIDLLLDREQDYQKYYQNQGAKFIVKWMRSQITANGG